MTLSTRSLSLRTRATIGFGLVALLVALVLALVTQALTRSYLIEQRTDAALQQTFVNARLARSLLRQPDPDIPAFLSGLGGTTASTSILRYQGETFTTAVTSGTGEVPRDLLQVVGDDQAGTQRYRDADGGLHLAVGVPIAATAATYFELFSLEELEGTLGALNRALAVAATGVAIGAALVGRGVASRLVQPLRPVSEAAQRISAGALDTRLDPVADPDLRGLIDAFNTMAESLETRIEREARFAADVSHELRSPLAGVVAALDVINRRRGDLPHSTQGALDVLASKVDTFQQMVIDLLEISKIDAGTATLTIDVIDLRHFVERLIDFHEAKQAVCVFTRRAATHLRADRRRLAQSLGNLIENAQQYGGGLTRIEVDSPTADLVRFTLDDQGPGIADHERDVIFGRFARGDAGLKAGSATGSGLGLALVSQHVALHQGRIWVESAPGGGARFIVEIPEGASP